jgi:hypothetical protein
MGKEKLLPAHKRAIELLEEDPIRHFDTLAAIYECTIVPEKDIPELLEAFSKAKNSIVKKDAETVNNVFYALYKQAESAESEQVEKSESEGK